MLSKYTDVTGINADGKHMMKTGTNVKRTRVPATNA
jgi:hypothetical protein